METSIVETRCIETSKGQLIVEMTHAFTERVKHHFGLFGSQRLEDWHIRSYVLEAIGTAVTKAERETKENERSVDRVSRISHRKDDT